MHRQILILIIVFFYLPQIASCQTTPLSDKERAIFSDELSKLTKNFGKFAKLEERHKEEFKNLFVKEAVIYNDIPYLLNNECANTREELTKPSLNLLLEAYIKSVKAEFPENIVLSDITFRSNSKEFSFSKRQIIKTIKRNPLPKYGITHKCLIKITKPVNSYHSPSKKRIVKKIPLKLEVGFPRPFTENSQLKILSIEQDFAVIPDKEISNFLCSDKLPDTSIEWRIETGSSCRKLSVEQDLQDKVNERITLIAGKELHFSRKVDVNIQCCKDCECKHDCKPNCKPKCDSDCNCECDCPPPLSPPTLGKKNPITLLLSSGITKSVMTGDYLNKKSIIRSKNGYNIAVNALFLLNKTTDINKTTDNFKLYTNIGIGINTYNFDVKINSYEAEVDRIDIFNDFHERQITADEINQAHKLFFANISMGIMMQKNFIKQEKSWGFYLHPQLLLNASLSSKFDGEGSSFEYKNYYEENRVTFTYQKNPNTNEEKFNIDYDLQENYNHEHNKINIKTSKILLIASPSIGITKTLSTNNKRKTSSMLLAGFSFNLPINKITPTRNNIGAFAISDGTDDFNSILEGSPDSKLKAWGVNIGFLFNI